LHAAVGELEDLGGGSGDARGLGGVLVGLSLLFGFVVLYDWKWWGLTERLWVLLDSGGPQIDCLIGLHGLLASSAESLPNFRMESREKKNSWLRKRSGGRCCRGESLLVRGGLCIVDGDGMD
tara:strand:+ start:397 stop:762 length:366 start_codon:yes stop_codon:yes gene_type:complete